MIQIREKKRKTNNFTLKIARKNQKPALDASRFYTSNQMHRFISRCRLRFERKKRKTKDFTLRIARKNQKPALDASRFYTPNASLLTVIQIRIKKRKNNNFTLENARKNQKLALDASGLYTSKSLASCHDTDSNIYKKRKTCNFTLKTNIDEKPVIIRLKSQKKIKKPH